ncbi:MAG: hypothetical protein PHP75_01645 [Methylacidiphilaceae bacterium]|nr:hypothetical protein [Candidatus Methylacidiphilaceae bacterium]
MQELLAACEQQRTELRDSLEELRTPVRVLEVGWRLAQVVRPGLRLFRELQDEWKLQTPKKAKSSPLSVLRFLSWAERARLALMVGRWVGGHLLRKSRGRA